MTYWLIEYFGLDIVAYVSGPVYGHEWTICFNHRKAVQFPDKESAEAEIKRLNLKSHWKAVEHGFIK